MSVDTKSMVRDKFKKATISAIERELSQIDYEEGEILKSGKVFDEDVDDLDHEPGDLVRVNMGGCGSVTNARVFAVILIEGEDPFYEVLVDPDEKEGHIHFVASSNWVE
jgi:hypothetical protein